MYIKLSREFIEYEVICNRPMGYGSFKTCYRMGQDRVLLIPEGDDEAIQEFKDLQFLAKKGLRVPLTMLVKATGDYGILMAQELLCDVWNEKALVDDFNKLRFIATRHKFHIDDFQWMTDSAGSMVIHDPMTICTCDCSDYCDFIKELDVYLAHINKYKRAVKSKYRSVVDFVEFIDWRCFS